MHAIISSIEHSAIEEQMRILERLGLQVSRIDPDSKGHIEAEQIESRIRKETALICIMNVNNETGAIQNIKAIAESIKETVLQKKILRTMRIALQYQHIKFEDQKESADFGLLDLWKLLSAAEDKSLA